MDQFVVVTHPEPIVLEARTIEHDALPEGVVALGYYHDEHLVARGAVAPEAVDAIRLLLRTPVSVALAATEDEDGNIEGRVCLVLPVDAAAMHEDEDDEPDEPWKSSVPAPAFELEGTGEDEAEPHLALLPIGNVLRSVKDRHHPDEVEVDVWEMLDNLLHGRAQDATSKAIDDLLGSL